MTDFIRVNGGVAFAVGEVLTSTDCNAFRTNDDVLWAMNSLRFTRQEIGYSTEPELFGPFSWLPYDHCYASLMANGAGAPPYYMLSATIGGNGPLATTAAVARLTNMTNTWRPQVGGFSDGVNVAVYAETVGTPKAALAKFPLGCAFDTFTVVYSGATALDFKPFDGYSSGPVSVGATTPKLLFPGIKISTTKSGALLVQNSSGAITATVGGSSYGTGAYAFAVNTAKTKAIAAAATGANSYLFVYDDATGFSDVLVPMHTGSSGDIHAVAYDARLGKFALLSVDSASPTTYVLWTTSSDGVTWSGSVGWYKIPVLSGSIIRDFTITPEGIWLILLSDEFNLRQTLLASIDGGIAWNEAYSIFTPGDGHFYDPPYRFATDGPGIVISGRYTTTEHAVIYGGKAALGTTTAAVAI